MAFGNGGLLPLNFSESFIKVGAEIGVLLLLFMLGLEYTAQQLKASLRNGLPAGIADLALNFTPGLAAGLLLGWKPLAAVLLGGVTYISSSGVIARVLMEFDRMSNPETPAILSLLVLEDLAMAVYLPLVGVLLIGQSILAGFIAVAIALGAAGLVLLVAVRHSVAISRLVSHKSDEVILLTTFGLVLLVAGLAQRFQVSSAIGAFLVGIALSGPVVERAHRLVGPLRDLFAAIFFFFFGMQIDPSALPSVLLLAAGLGIVTALTKIAAGWWALRDSDVAPQARLRAGVALIARGEFSIVIANLGVSVGLEPALGPLSAAYVLLMALARPMLLRAVEPFFAAAKRKKSRAPVVE
ncbi:MAG TPA: cation:proton antiporter [Blastocatellia bacterium]|nr:cation:proton antiporter [Blastocatellia bacterium]